MKENELKQSKIFGHFQLVEKVISAFGVDPEKARAEKPLQWTIYQNKIPIWFRLIYIKSLKEYFIQISSPIVHMPTENKDTFCKQLVSLNSTMVSAAFVEKRGMVYISAGREVIDLSLEEGCNLVSRVMTYTSFYHRAQKKGLLNWPVYSPPNANKPGPSSLS